MQHPKSGFSAKSILNKHLLVLVLSVIVGGFTAIHSGQDVNYDLLNYHYDNPYALVHNRIERDLAPAQLESYENPLIDLPGYFAIDYLKPRAAAGVLGMIQGLNIWIIFEISLLMLRRVKTKENIKLGMALLIGVLSFFGAAAKSEVGSTMGDNLVSILILGSLFLFLSSLDRLPPRYKPNLIRLSAYLVMGAAIGLKLTSAIYGIGLLVAGLVAASSLKQKIKDGCVNLLALILGIGLTGGFWYVKMISLFGNPIFPFYNGIFHSRYYSNTNFKDTRWLPVDFGKTVSRPFDFMHQQSIASELSFRDPRLSISIVAALTLFVFTVWRLWGSRRVKLQSLSKVNVAFWTFFTVSLLVWLVQFGYYRYLMPVEMLCAVAIAVAVYGIVKKFMPAAIIILALLIYSTLQTIPVDWGRTPWQPTYFGVTKGDFSKLEGTTVLMSGYAPLGFLVPYLPASSQTIRIGSDLTSPDQGTAAMQGLMKRAVHNRQKAHSQFYALRADEDKPAAKRAFAQYGFKVTSCEDLKVYVRQTNESKFRLCKLEKIN